MRKPDAILDEIHAIRRRIDEKTRDMSASEATAHFNATGRRLAEKYGFRRVTADEVRGYSRAATTPR